MRYGHSLPSKVHRACPIQAARDFPAVVLVSPRQSGKTTAAKHTFGKTHRYVSLEPPDVRATATSEPRLYFWRTSAGDEVDLIAETATGLVPIEIKLSSTPNPTMAAGIKLFQQLFGGRACNGYVVHTGEGTLPLGREITAIPFDDL